jgi:hypothetical protein
MGCVPELSDGDQLGAMEVLRPIKAKFAWLLVRLIKAVSNLSTETCASLRPTSLCVMRGLNTLSEQNGIGTLAGEAFEALRLSNYFNAKRS